MSISEFKERIMEWSGFHLKGETPEELKENLQSIISKMENEVFQEGKSYRLTLDEILK